MKRPYLGSCATVEAVGHLTGGIAHAQNGALILVVEDDAEVLRVAVGMLTELGYRTVIADGGATALNLLDSHPEVELLFTDIVMRDMNGRRLADAALERRSDLKVLFTTGYTRNAIVHGGVLDPGVEFIMKPFSLEALAHKVDQVLRKPPPDRASNGVE